jgi:hypothetical protein
VFSRVQACPPGVQPGSEALRILRASEANVVLAGCSEVPTVLSSLLGLGGHYVSRVFSNSGPSSALS